MGARCYSELVVWQKAIALVTEIYRSTHCFPKLPKHEIYGLTGQIRRAAVSIPSHRAAGKTLTRPPEFSARGSRVN